MWKHSCNNVTLKSELQNSILNIIHFLSYTMHRPIHNHIFTSSEYCLDCYKQKYLEKISASPRSVHYLQ